MRNQDNTRSQKQNKKKDNTPIFSKKTKNDSTPITTVLFVFFFGIEFIGAIVKNIISSTLLLLFYYYYKCEKEI